MPVFVIDQQHVTGGAAQPVDHLQGGQGFVDHRNLAHQGQGIERRLGRRQQVAAVQDADDIVPPVSAQRQARMARACETGQDFGAAFVDPRGHDLAARCHQPAGAPVREPHDAADQLFLGAVDDAGPGRFGQHQADVLVADRGFAAVRLSDETQDKVAGAIEKPDQRRPDPGQDQHRRGNAAGDPFRRRQCDPFGHEFSDDQGQVGYDDHDQTHPDLFRHGFGNAEFGKPLGQAQPDRGA